MDKIIIEQTFIYIRYAYVPLFSVDCMHW